MKKRIFSCFMALALCLTLLPATAQAEDGHSPHPICGKTCSHTGPGEKQHQNDAFKNAKWMASYTGKLSVGSPEGSIYGDGLTEKDNYVILTTGYYYLSYTADGCDHSYVRSLKTIKIQGDVTICLNGKQIQNIGDTTGPVFEVPTGSTLTLTDCTGNGQIIRDSSFSNGSGVYVNGGTLNLYSGQITKSTGQQGTVSNKNNYGGVYVNNGGTFNMYGGFITGNSANYGGGVYVKSGTFNMYGGTIKENTSSEGYGSGFGGAGVYVEASGNFIMNNDASVTGNKATGYGATLNGGGVFVNGGTFTMNDNASVTGNKAKNGTLNGGGVYVSGNGTFTMNNNASVTGNKTANNNATLNGGGVYVNGGTFNMNDGAIRGNAATNNGGGVYVNGGTFTMNGNASIKSNTAKNGGGVYASAGTFNMNGNASIKSNTGNGVCVSDTARFTVSDTPTVTENTMNGNDSNVYLNGGAYITIGKVGLTDGASIGVTKTVDSSAAGIVIATDVNEDYSDNFSSDDSTYVVKHDTDNNKLVLAKSAVTHTHIWTYTANNATITAICANTDNLCNATNGGSVTIKASTTTYDSTEKPATVEKSGNWESAFSKSIPITYEQKNGDTYTSMKGGVPTEVGKYKASITVGGKIAFVEYEITGSTTEIVPVSQITLNKTSTSISVGNSEKLTATVTPENAANKDLKWASSDTSVATVAADGTVTAVKAGTATITATAADGSGKSATCTVTVTGGTTPSQPGGSTGAMW